jgi:2Fe-2S ferredoxin
MPQITYVDAGGQERTVEVSSGTSVMEGAIRNGIPGVLAECGGACSCATCHVYVDQSWTSRIGNASETERAMLEYANDARHNSRLACQITMTDALNGLRVTTPETQGG